MTAINRIDQAILLLKDRLNRLQERSGTQTTRAGGTAGAETADPLQSLRQIARQGAVGEDELRRALVRTLLADSLGAELAGNLEFQSISEQVARILEGSESGRALLDRALAELD